MEESEKRRERLRAMRMEAAQADVANYVETSRPNHFSNPLLESSAMAGQPEPCTAPRFDYYTNPMAAFAANKKRGKIDNQTVSDNYVPSHHNNSPATYIPPYVPPHVPPHHNNSPATYVPPYVPPHVPPHHNNAPATYVPPHHNNAPATYVPPHHNNSPATYVPPHHNNSPATNVPSNFPGLRNPEMSTSPTHQLHQHSPDQRTFYARGFNGTGGHGSPAMPRPFPMDQGTPGMWSEPRRPFVNHFCGRPPPRGTSSPRSPFVNQFPGHLPMEMSSPSVVSGPRGNSYTNPTQDRVSYHSPSPSPGYQSSSSPGGGRHRHRGNMTPSPRFAPGRGGSHGRRFSSDESPSTEQFYNASMLEDPWKVLQPSIWRPSAPLSSSANPSESWISKFNTKKSRVSDSSGKSSSQPSLAEYLAASFNEAVNEAPSV